MLVRGIAIYCFYGAAYPDLNLSGGHQQLALGQDFISAKYGDRDNGYAGFYCQHHGTGFEVIQFAILAAGAFRKNNNRSACSNFLCSFIQAFNGYIPPGAWQAPR